MVYPNIGDMPITYIYIRETTRNAVIVFWLKEHLFICAHTYLRLFESMNQGVILAWHLLTSILIGSVDGTTRAMPFIPLCDKEHYCIYSKAEVWWLLSSNHAENGVLYKVAWRDKGNRLIPSHEGCNLTLLFGNHCHFSPFSSMFLLHVYI